MNDGFGRDTAHHIRLLVDQVPSMLAYWDRDLRCRFANRAYERWFGVNPDSLIGTSIRDLLGPELFALNEPHIRAVLRGEEQLFERIVPGPGGIKRHSLASYLPDIVDGEVAGFMVQVTEVTKLKETEAALRAEAAERERANDRLRRSDSALREAQRLGQIGSWEWEVGADITTWSDELYRIFGRDPSRLPPSFAEHPQIYTAESWSRLQDAVDRALRTGEPYVLELEYLRPDGSSGWIEGRGEVVREADGSVLRLRGTALDVSARRQMEQVRLQRDLAEAANRNKTLFLSHASHELRTPLNGILGFAQLLETDAGLDARQHQWAEAIHQSGRRMQALVESILDLASAELGQLGLQRIEVDLCELVREGLARCAEPAAQSRVTLLDRLPATGALPLDGDPRRLAQVVDCLLRNAIQYSQAGGCVTLSAQDLGERVELTIEDSGPGMSPDQLSRLFLPFERLEAENTLLRGGSAVGLALSKKLVELMDGDIRVESAPGQGALFTVTLPARRA